MIKIIIILMIDLLVGFIVLCVDGLLVETGVRLDMVQSFDLVAVKWRT